VTKTAAAAFRKTAEFLAGSDKKVYLVTVT
jgi:hypothetical protein